MSEGSSAAGPVDPATITAVWAAFPTSRHAEMVMDALIPRLGDSAVVETADKGRLLSVCRRDRDDSDWIVPWPMLRFSRGKRFNFIMGASGPPSNVPPPGRGGPPSLLRGLTPGEIQLSDGRYEITLTFGQDGKICEASWGAVTETLPELTRALTERAGNPTEMLIDYLVALDPGRAGPGRVHRPVPSPTTVRGSWRTGLYAVRGAIHEGRVPDAACWVAADGFVGTVICPAATRAEAIAQCREEIARLRPRPPEPEPRTEPREEVQPEVPAEPQPEPPAEPFFETAGGVEFSQGPFVITGPVADVEPDVEPVPENTPIALIELMPIPEEPPPLGSWRRFLDDQGASSLAAVRQDERGFTLIGSAALERIDLATLDAQLAAAERAYERVAEWINKPVPHQGPSRIPPLDSLILRFTVEEGAGGEVEYAVRQGSRTSGFDARTFGAEGMAEVILRQRWVGGEQA